MNEYLVDTDILSFYMKGDTEVRNKVEEYLMVGGFERLTISEITYYEIRAGLEYQKVRQQIKLFEEFVAHCKTVKLTKASLDTSARIYRRLRKKGIEIGTPDLLVAGIALNNDFVLVTNNEQHYQPIDRLKITNWKI